MTGDVASVLLSADCTAFALPANASKGVAHNPGLDGFLQRADVFADGSPEILKILLSWVWCPILDLYLDVAERPEPQFPL
eukprot:CAMPEP_0180740108 /NCGR_PEP_ID=MMETSP1038_2-20121128/25707_1 /TAXON_ID=632150 /ORGANISM="Azadinium spinosum, Strain 3D9" /LENGTH=79 /DNA_ID=CAMNT_0022773373 /DNA_START=194 /DNA_END=432 /DNA_ORIENTATION=-